ncbi:MAG: cysteine-rich CWC family protein [Aquabacterium sp.]|uniref:cysteine-rich CWC family protein n=1 Tax=Aquabacterium sp. TaxID=1872578 RepID=UPI003BB0B951
MTSPTPLPHHACPLCGGPNACAPARSGSFDTPCWCREVKVSPLARARVAGHQPMACLCERCAVSGGPLAPDATSSASPGQSSS